MIQIIEDDLVTCHIITAVLQRMRQPYCTAHTGAEAMEQLRTRPIDLVIADLMLPDMHGLALLEHKHNQPHLRDIPVMCCTGQADIETVEKALAFGAVDFVKKPIDVQLFSGRVLRALERAPERWESSRAMSKRLSFQSGAMQSMLPIAQQVLRELDEALANAQQHAPQAGALDAMIARASGAALNVGALRTAQLIELLWSGSGAAVDLEHLRAALVIELASFDEAIQARDGDAAPAAHAPPPIADAPAAGAESAPPPSDTPPSETPEVSASA